MGDGDGAVENGAGASKGGLGKPGTPATDEMVGGFTPFSGVDIAKGVELCPIFLGAGIIAAAICVVRMENRTASKTCGSMLIRHWPSFVMESLGGLFEISSWPFLLVGLVQ